MSSELAKLEAFISKWREPLEAMATVDFSARMLDGEVTAPTQAADNFSAENGFESIGFNWELLDSHAKPSEVRSALGAFKDAFSLDLVMNSQWLGDVAALECGREFIASFKPLQRMFLTNHIIREEGKSEMWNPVTTRTFDWAFVGMDDRKIAILVVSADD